MFVLALKQPVRHLAIVSGGETRTPRSLERLSGSCQMHWSKAKTDQAC